jgi:hypothetical protein
LIEDLSEVELSYLAGIVDGEGCISLHGRRDTSKGYCTPALQITNSDRRLIDWLQDRLGGRVYQEPERENRKPIWRWCVFGAQARTIILRVEQWLIVKGEQARLVISLGDGGHRNCMSDEERGRRIAAIAQMRELNRRGRR